ncbi:transposase mutator type [Pseudobacteroides cellulosolvens ATCC 35603 = DSM 2933]|uniref:Mutator family transposase n=2 Tax=Pseudobacteroides cellulosolvens TaxID=35825 RepID=A0A0L6JXM8_9FIRM|nr:transposase mutator type [Pseudobacteroides cellulosolvens ATCC 35603 = DSM 2933]KNY30611.1 transposase mutator type [Pseudobacteroides cellulosolvens ATCC 35603 = DSM 2933]
MSTLTKEQVKAIVQGNNFQSVSDVSAYLKDIFRDVIQELLEAELEVNLGYSKEEPNKKNTDNSRNGYTPKTLKSEFGEVEIQVPRDRKGEFQPKIVPKYQRNVTGIEDKVISLYASGMSTRDISKQVEELYGIDFSAEMVSRITDRIVPEIKEWQQRPLESIYSFVFLDAIHYKVRDDGRIVNRAAYVVLGVTVDGSKDVLGIWIGDNESSKFWLGVLNDLKNRGVKDVLIFCVDGLTGLRDAINAAYPKAEVQRCIIHQLRNSFKYVSYKDAKEFSSDFKEVYQAINEDVALEKLYELKEKWGKEYPFAIRSWENNWDVLSPFYKFSEEVRKIIYTTYTEKIIMPIFYEIPENKRIPEKISA